MNIKLILSIIGAVIGTIAFYPYIRNIFRGKTQPHAYTWLILVLTQGIGTVGIWYGKGGWGGLGLAVGTVLTFFVFLLSLRYGSKNIRRADTFVLMAALAAIVVWWQLKNPFLAVLLAGIIDVASYVPSFRKSLYEPWSETVSLWAGFFIGNSFAIAALKEYNFLTLFYLLVINAANITLVLICLLRRPMIPKPVQAG